jgi:hypothetical protein
MAGIVVDIYAGEGPFASDNVDDGTHQTGDGVSERCVPGHARL